MKNIFKLSLLTVLCVASTAQAGRFAFAKRIVAAALAYNAVDTGCIVASTPYWIMRSAEKELNRIQSNDDNPVLAALPTVRYYSIAAKLDVASRIQNALNAFKNK